MGVIDDVWTARCCRDGLAVCEICGRCAEHHADAGCPAREREDEEADEKATQ